MTPESSHPAVESPSAKPEASRESDSIRAGTESRALYLSPLKVILGLALVLLFGEFLTILLHHRLHPLPRLTEAALATLVLLGLLIPYHLAMYRPFRRHWDELQRSLEENRQLSRQLIQTAEEEKRRLARDMHDECGQVLVALQLGMETLQHFPAGNDPAMGRQIAKLVGLVGQMEEHIRDVSARLRPAMLENVGLAPTLNLHVQQLGRQVSEILFRYHSLGTASRLSWEAEIALFRICQEALNNVIRHSRAKRVYITLDWQPQRVVLVVEDDGTGFDQRGVQQSPVGNRGLGLWGMRERVASIGGRLDVISEPGKGTLVRAEVPRSGGSA